MSLTAIVTNVKNYSALQCWALRDTLTTFQSTGTVDAYALPFGDFFNTVYAIVPPHFDRGLHNVPAARVVVFISGIAKSRYQQVMIMLLCMLVEKALF